MRHLVRVYAKSRSFELGLQNMAEVNLTCYFNLVRCSQERGQERGQVRFTYQTQLLKGDWTGRHGRKVRAAGGHLTVHPGFSAPLGKDVDGSRAMGVHRVKDSWIDPVETG